MKPRLLSLIVILFFGCSGPETSFTGVNIDEWKSDRNGCNGIRAASIETFRQERLKLKALSEMEVVDVLGKPDLNELSKRNQKFYYYFLQPGTLCQNGDSSALKLVVRFNAVGLAREISVE